ncbi:MAG: glucosaminidase domain-containing protein [Bryobacteraceae bacterium]|nr:glucosaminidase domain-containing protein [Bryobacteraceae bacterium]
MTRQEFFARIIPGAVAAEDHYGVPAEMIVSQAAIETGWGRSPIGTNFFGIKKAIRHKRSEWKVTREVLTQAQINRIKKDLIITVTPRSDGKLDVILRQEFAGYLNVMAGILDHAYLVSSLGDYRAHFQRFKGDNDFAVYVRGVARVYATDPNYGNLLWTIINQRNVLEACETERARG